VYGGQLPTTGFTSVVYAVVGACLVALSAVGAVARRVIMHR